VPNRKADRLIEAARKINDCTKFDNSENCINNILMLVRPYLFRSIKLTPLFAFSRTRRPPLSPKEQPTEDEIQLPEVDFNNFNFLKSLKDIRVSSSRSKSKFVNEISKQCN